MIDIIVRVPIERHLLFHKLYAETVQNKEKWGNTVMRGKPDKYLFSQN